MANRRKLIYIARFVVLCWIAIAAFVGIVLGLAHLVKNNTVLLIMFLVAILSSLFGVLGSQVYMARSKRDEWPQAKRDDRGLATGDNNETSEPEDAEDRDSGSWK